MANTEISTITTTQVSLPQENAGPTKAIEPHDGIANNASEPTMAPAVSRVNSSSSSSKKAAAAAAAAAVPQFDAAAGASGTDLALEFQDICSRLQQKTQARAGGPPASNIGMMDIKTLHGIIQTNIGSIQQKTCQILQDQEEDLLRSFSSRLGSLDQALQKERAKSASGASEWVDKCEQLSEELNWLKAEARKIEAENRELKENKRRLEWQLETADADRKFLARQLIALKRENKRLRKSRHGGRTKSMGSIEQQQLNHELDSRFCSPQSRLSLEAGDDLGSPRRALVAADENAQDLASYRSSDDQPLQTEVESAADLNRTDREDSSNPLSCPPSVQGQDPSALRDSLDLKYGRASRKQSERDVSLPLHVTSEDVHPLRAALRGAGVGDVQTVHKHLEAAFKHVLSPRGRLQRSTQRSPCSPNGPKAGERPLSARGHKSPRTHSSSIPAIVPNSARKHIPSSKTPHTPFSRLSNSGQIHDNITTASDADLGLEQFSPRMKPITTRTKAKRKKTRFHVAAAAIANSRSSRREKPNFSASLPALDQRRLKPTASVHEGRPNSGSPRLKHGSPRMSLMGDNADAYARISSIEPHKAHGLKPSSLLGATKTHRPLSP